MTVKELYTLRELFWKLNRQELVVFQKLCNKQPIKGTPTKLTEGVDEFLRNIRNMTTDEELKSDVARMLSEIAAVNAMPFANL